MPNPFKGNAEAAMYVAGLSTKQAQQEQVNRLYYESIDHHTEVMREAVNSAYPKQPVRTVTSAEVENFFEKSVIAPVLKKNEHLRKIEHEAYGSLRRPLSPISDKEITKRCYEDQMAILKRSKEKMLKDLEKKGIAPKVVIKDPVLMERERKFVRRVHKDVMKQWAREVLVHNEPMKMSKPLKFSSKREEAEHWNRKAQPRKHQTQEKVHLEKGPHFTVYTKNA